MNFLNKYLKYKNKYLNLKKMFGGSDIESDDGSNGICNLAAASGLCRNKKCGKCRDDEKVLRGKTMIRGDKVGTANIEKVEINSFLNILKFLDPKTAVNLLMSSPTMIGKLYSPALQQYFDGTYDFSELDEDLLTDNQYYNDICNIYIDQMSFAENKKLSPLKKNCKLFLIKLKLLYMYKKYIEETDGSINFTNDILKEILSKTMVFYADERNRQVDEEKQTDKEKKQNIRILQDFITSLIPNAYKMTSINTRAFYERNLNGWIIIPNSVEVIQAESFMNNELTELEIPDSVTTIEMGAFSYNKLTELVIPDSVINIGENAFSQNELTNLVISESVKVIPKHCFSNNKLTKLKIPDKVATIGIGAFSNNKLDILKIPDTVTNMGLGAFANNELTKLEISNSLKTINAGAFFSNKLKQIVIPNTVTLIMKSAFQNNELTKVTIPNSVKTIEEKAFKNNQLTELTVPSSVKTIDFHAFNDNPLKIIIMSMRFESLSKNFCNSDDVKYKYT
jgi:hypothetical protein